MTEKLQASTEHWTMPFMKLRERLMFNVNNCKDPDIKLPLATELQT